MEPTRNLPARPPSGGASPRRLQVLVIDEEFPFPLNAGKRIRTWNLLRRLAPRHAITWLCFGPVEPAARAAAADAGVDLQPVGALPDKRGAALYLALLRNCFSRYPYSVDKHYAADFRERLQQLVASGKFDLVHCEWSPYARYLASAPGIPSVVMAHNVESQIWARRSEHSGTWLERQYFGWQARKMRTFERDALAKTSRVIAVSEPDQRQFAADSLQQLEVVENGVDIDYFQPAPETSAAANQMLFLASLDWFPNQDSLTYFLAEIFPLIRKASSAATLRVVGRRMPPALAAQVKAVPGVDFIGEVDDVRAQYPASAVVIVPLRIGGGSRLKILEAMAAGKAVVSTTVGAEGINVQHGRDIVLADTPEAFAREALRLLADAAERERLGKNARQIAVEKYSWESLAAKLESIWLAAAEARRA